MNMTQMFQSISVGLAIGRWRGVVEEMLRLHPSAGTMATLLRNVVQIQTVGTVIREHSRTAAMWRYMASLEMSPAGLGRILSNIAA